MPLKILNPALYQDKTVQDWHRNTFPATWWAIDLDLLGACYLCRIPLYLIESTTNPNKATSILVRLADMAGLPALVILHSAGQIVGGKLLRPTLKSLSGESEVRAQLSAIRLKHGISEHPHMFSTLPEKTP